MKVHFQAMHSSNVLLRSMKRSVCLLGMIIFTAPRIDAAESPEGQARAFVAKCLKDPAVFVSNPPVEENPFRNLTPEQREKRLNQASKNGSILYLYPNGLPAHFETNKEHLDHGPSKSWYPNGQTQSDELFESGTLVTGIYFNFTGVVLGEIKDGNGRQFLFNEPDESHDIIAGVVEYQNGLKHGLGILYRDFSKKIKWEEAHYDKGQLHGIRARWMPRGQKNSEETFKNGMEDGAVTFWHENGQVSAILHYVQGRPTGVSQNFYSNGEKAAETGRSNQMTYEKKWYPGGKLIVEKSYDDKGLVSAQSFDRKSRPTGTIKNGEWVLVVCKELANEYQGDTRQVEFYQGGRLTRQSAAPEPIANYHYSPNGVTIEGTLEITPQEPLESISVVLSLPQNITSNKPVAFSANDIKSGYTVKLGDFNLTLPQPYKMWTGEVWADVEMVLADRTPVRYQYAAIRNIKERETFPVHKEEEVHEEKPRERTENYRLFKNGSPHGKSFESPPFAKVKEAWSDDKNSWLLYDFPSMLIFSENEDTDEETSYKCLRKDFSFSPQGLAFWSTHHFLIWGIKPTAIPEKGIPYVVEETKDWGKTWSAAKIPELDYLLGIAIMDKTMVASGIRLPLNGLPAGKDWFELPRTSLISSNGVHFLEETTPGFLDVLAGLVVSKAIAPNGRYRAFLSDHSFLDPSFELRAAKGKDNIPESMLSTGRTADIVWSGNSRIIALRAQDLFFAFVDLENGKSESCEAGLDFDATQKARDDLTDFHEKTILLLKKNDH